MGASTHAQGNSCVSLAQVRMLGAMFYLWLWPQRPSGRLPSFMERLRTVLAISASIKALQLLLCHFLFA